MLIYSISILITIRNNRRYLISCQYLQVGSECINNTVKSSSSALIASNTTSFPIFGDLVRQFVRDQ